jgi:hypothetical protein
MGVDVRGGADVGMAGEHLGELEVAGAAQEVRDRRMPGLRAASTDPYPSNPRNTRRGEQDELVLG